ncbi:hypothetical protein [Rothia koreensis]|uniref:hypothetical protein n=1 Tax=Rothia koreensis TaxID=592378 RepID=UPI003FCCA7B0
MSVQDSRRADAESATTTANEHVGSHLGKVFGVSVLAALIVTVFVLAFTWPTKTSEAHNMPVSVAGPKKAVDQFEDKINEKSGDTFDFVSADSRDDAVDQIKHRETYGAVILAEQPGTPEVLTAPASNSAATQVMSGIADQFTQQIKGQITGQVEQMKAASGGQLKPEQAQKALVLQEKAADTKVAETEVVPLSDDDSNGSGLAVAAFPLVLGGMLGGVMITFLVKGVWRRLIAAVVYGAAAGHLHSGVYGDSRGTRNRYRRRRDHAPGQSAVRGAGPVAIHGRALGEDRTVHGARRVQHAAEVPELLPRRPDGPAVVDPRRVGRGRGGTDRLRALPPQPHQR